MFHLMLQKLLHKKWMMISLLVGITLLVAVAVSHTMYQDASLAWMLEQDLDAYVEEHNADPGLIQITGKMNKNTAGSDDFSRAEELAEAICGLLGFSQEACVRIDEMTQSTVTSEITKGNDSPESKISLAHMSDLADHVKVVSGRMYAEADDAAAGADSADAGVDTGAAGESDDSDCIEAVVTLKAAIERDYIVGEILDYNYMKDADGNHYRVKIVGVVTWADSSDDYWIASPDEYTKEVFVTGEAFEEVAAVNSGQFERRTDWYVTFDTAGIDHRDAQKLISQTYRLMNSYSGNGVALSRPAYLGILENFLDSRQKIMTTLVILEVPMLALLCAFLFMISRQMYVSEQAELALLQSRGASRRQILSLYVMQAAVLGAVGLALGLFLGSLFCRAIGSAGAFLEFTQRRSLTVRLTAETWAYAAAAVLLSIVMMVLPALTGRDTSIVEQKRKRARSARPMWQKLFLDLVALGVSLYGYYSFSRQKAALTAAVVAGDSIDPLLYLSSFLFMLGASLFVLRLLPYLVKLVYAIGKKHWRPASYAAFLELLRTGNRLYFIETFLMLAVAMGVFGTCVARTIETNADTNTAYHTGADLVIQEKWPDNSAQRQFDDSLPLVYTEPDYGKYDLVEGIASKTQVYVDRSASLSGSNSKEALTLYGIHTKTFGETTSLPDGCMEQHYYTYLNELAGNADAVLVSASFRDILGYSIGDSISYSSDGSDTVKGVIADFVDYFPGFTPQEVELNPDGSTYIKYNYLIVANLSTLQQKWGVIPYEIWFKMEDGATTDDFYRFVEENNVKLSKCVDLSEEEAATRKDTIFQGTNGILTMSFIIVLLLCGIGYLIYWILSVKSRELLFGVLRAMGLGKGSVAWMLAVEQLFASIFPLLAGAGVGAAASVLFVPLIQIAYSASDTVLPMELVVNRTDIAELFGMIGVMLLVCFALLARQVLTSGIAQALKLGED